MRSIWPTRLAAVWRGEAPEAELERFDKQRRLVTLETIQKTTIQNKKNLELPGDEFRDSLRAIAADPARTRDYLMRVSMIAEPLRAPRNWARIAGSHSDGSARWR